MSTASELHRQIQSCGEDLDRLRRELAKRIVGQEDAISAMFAAMLAGGHLLLEGLPGTGKTLLARALADAVDLCFQRIQCTADLMPADIIGTYVVMESPQGRRTFEFQKGPLFANLVLADHINRAPPRTQSALLEAMDEESITVSTESFALPRPYLIIATENPLESDGAYPLPDAQVDRFLLKVTLPPPTSQQLEAILDRTVDSQPIPKQKVISAERILAMGELARRLPTPQSVRQRAVAIIAATQPQSDEAPPLVRRLVRYGSSPRGAQAMVLAAKARAVMAGRSEVTKEDLDYVVLPALRHRLNLNYDAVAENIAPDAILAQVIEKFAAR